MCSKTLDRILLFSTNPERALPVARALAQDGREVRGIWTTSEKAWPDSEFSISRIPKGGSVSDWAAQIALELPDLIVVAGFTALLPDAIVKIPRLGVINLHAGRVPEYRGGSPLNWQIIQGETAIGISVLRLTQALDAGPLLKETTFALNPEDDIASVHEKANALFPPLVSATVKELFEGRSLALPQKEENAAYWHQRRREDGRVSFGELNALSAHNLVRAITRPYPGAYAEVQGVEVVIYKTELLAQKICGVPGRILYLQGDGPFVVCRDRALKIVEYAAADGRRLNHGDYLK